MKMGTLPLGAACWLGEEDRWYINSVLYLVQRDTEMNGILHAVGNI